MSMLDDLIRVQAEFRTTLYTTSSLESLEKLRTAYLGRKGIINQLLTEIKYRPLDEKKQAGLKINQFKTTVEKELQQHQDTLLKNREGEAFFDVTLPGKKRPKGSLHLVTLAIEEISRIFERLGFVRLSYPEVEWEYFAFEALNMPKGHPARDDFETFFLDVEEHPHFGKMILTPHTSSGQVREMQRVKTPPIKMINTGKCYRPNWDTTHTPMFHQFEGLCVDKGINLTHLKGTIEYFVQEFFTHERTVRFRPFHFQFTEPSFELDISCDLCAGQGKIREKTCRLCKSGWLELGGAGMVHPNVLKHGGIDPTIYSGWAFGFGVERNFMMKQGIKLNDARILYDGDVRFLAQF